LGRLIVCGSAMKQVPLPTPRLIAIASLTFALTLHASTMEPAVLGHQILALMLQNRNTALGLTTFAGLLVATLVQPAVGLWSDRVRSRLGRRLPFLIAGTALLVTCIYGVALAPTFPALVLFVLLMQVGSNTVQGPWQALIPDQVPESQHGRAAALKALLDMLAAVVGRLSAGYMISQSAIVGLPPAVGTVTVPALVLVGALVVTVIGAREPAHTAHAAYTHPANPAPPRQLLQAIRSAYQVDLRRYPAFGWWFANRLLFWCAFISLTIFLLFFAVDVLGMSEAGAQRYVAQVSVMLGGALVVATIPAGWLADRFGRKPLVAGAGCVAALGTLGILFMRDVGILTGIGLFIGVGVGAYLVAGWALITDIVPQREAAHYMGVANIATAGGSAAGRLLGGVLIDWLNALSGTLSTGYLVVYGLSALLFLASALAIIPLRLHVAPVPQKWSGRALDGGMADD
ncbi:MAG: MFS transporter, partial [Chloroflexi bacterium]|nr:MFS transporter [Chloroflexota bacterium]